MAEMGLQSYCQHIEHFSVDRLIEQIETLKLHLSEHSKRILQKCTQYRQMLDEQYSMVLGQGMEKKPNH